jgi:Zn-finger nucleic acid-binding protein
MDQGTDLRTCDRCGRASDECEERIVHTAWQGPSGRSAGPQRHPFWICPRCRTIWEGGHELGQTLIILGLIAFGSWLLNFPAVFWRWPQTAPRGHGALGAGLILGLTALGIVITASFNLKRWLRNKVLDALPAVEVPGWSPQEITPEKYAELIRGPEPPVDLGAAVAAVPLEPGRCAVCHRELDGSAARIVLRTGRETASQVTDVRRQGNSVMTTSLKTYGDIEDFEAQVCRGCWIDRRRNLRRTAYLFAGLFPVALVAVLIGFISGIKDAFLGLGLTALVFVGGISFYVVMLKWLQGRHPMAILKKRVTELRNRGRAKPDIIVVSTTWPPPRSRYFE